MLYFMSAIGDLKMVTVGSQRQNVSYVSGNFQLPTIYASSNREAERCRKERLSFAALKPNQLFAIKVKFELSSIDRF